MSGLFGLFGGERRSLENPALPLTSTALLDLLGGTPGDAGVAVTETSAMKMSAVFRCTSLISSVCASLPLHAYEAGTKSRLPDTLLADPHPELTGYELWKLTYVHRCLWGNAYLRKVRNGGGQVVQLWPVRPDLVRVGRVTPSEANPMGKMYEVTVDPEQQGEGRTVPMTPYELLHLPGLGYDGLVGLSLVRFAAQGIGLALAAESTGARLFGSGNLLSGLLTTEQRLDGATAKVLQERWRVMTGGLSRAHDVAVLDSGAKFQSLTMPTSDSQMLESRHFQVTDASRFWGVPPFLMLETEKSTSWGCLPGDALVFTTTGPKPIEDVAPGDEVWSFTGSGMAAAKVTAWHSTGYKPLLTIRTTTRELRVTANHRVPVRRYFGTATGKKPGQCSWETVEISAGEIEAGDYLLVPHGLGDGDRVVAPNGRKLTVRAAELCGLYVGDGSADKNRVEIAHAVDDPHMPYYRESIRREFGVEPYTDKRGTRSRFSSAAARSLLECGFTGKAHTKRVPGWVFRLSHELRLAFLRGYLDADGGIARGVVSFASCNPDLLEDVRHLCISVGVPAGRVRLSRRGGIGQIKGQLHVSRDKYVLNLSMTEQNHKIGSNHPAKLANLRTEPMRRTLRYADDWEGDTGVTARAKRREMTPGGTWDLLDVRLQRVVSIERGQVAVPVFDITVAEHAHYVADGVVVHNTGLEQQSQGWVTFDLHPQWLAPTEQRITKELLPGGRYAKYVVQGLLRGDHKARAEFYRTLRELGALNADEIRELEDMTPIPGGLGAVHLQPLNFGPLGSTPTNETDDGGSADAPPQPAGD